MLEDLHYLRERAQKASAKGAHDQAAAALFEAAQQTHVTETDYASVLRPLATALVQINRPRDALTVQWYLAHADKKQGGGDGRWAIALDLAARTPPEDLARTLAAAGKMTDAARAAESGGRVALAAIYREKAGDFAAARTLWSRLTQVLGQASGDAYLGGLVSFNLARCAAKCADSVRAREALVASVRMLEEAADQFESMGQRERAFDCFQVLVQIGHETHAFEHVLEGYVNAVRILREDHLKYFVLQHYDDALAAARERGEFSAAATLAREAASYARTIGMSAVARHYALSEGDLWEEVAREHHKRGASTAIAENAILAAILAYGEVGQFARIGRLYGELGNLDLEASRREHYTRAAGRYRSVADEPIEKNPLASRNQRGVDLPEVWHDDVLEWEEAGNAEDACADVLLDARWPELTRRRAMLARLLALRIPATPASTPEKVAAQAALAQRLAQVQVYAMLSPLEKLFQEPARPVRLAVLEALQTLFFKRSFVTIRVALRDGDAAIVAQGSGALRALHFPHAFDPLARILQESNANQVRAAALDAIAHIDSNEAAELLLGIFEHGSPEDKAAVTKSLSMTKAARFVELAKASFPSAPRPVQAELRDVLSARGVSL
jgi:hypothetical protein